MKKVWRVFVHEYTRHVFRRRFIFTLLSIPFFIAVVLGISVFAGEMQINRSPLGYVDHSTLLANPVQPAKSNSVFDRAIEILPFADEAAARKALDSGQIQAYYVIPPDYLDTSKVQLFYYKAPGNNIQGRFTTFMRANLLKTQPPEVAKRITEGDIMVIQSVDGTRRAAENDFMGFLMPFFSGILFMIIILTTGGYLLQAVVEEKENRTMEIVITSVSPDQLMAGKILGNISVGLTQMVAWMIFITIGILIGRTQVDWLKNIQIQPDYAVMMVLTLLPSFVMIGALMAALGSSVTEAREAQQISGLFTLPVVAPYWLVVPLMNAPNGPLAMILSFFPLTAPVTISLRAGLTQIPYAQFALNFLVLVLSAVIAVWLAARSFRLGMLSYGKKISLRQIFRRMA